MDRSLRRRGQVLVVVGALLGALVGVVLGLAVKDGPAGTAVAVAGPAGGTVDILLDPSNPGRWMVHCHIAEHLSAGMMAAFTVE